LTRLGVPVLGESCVFLRNSCGSPRLSSCDADDPLEEEPKRGHSTILTDSSFIALHAGFAAESSGDHALRLNLLGNIE
jgi:hypothetical protein